MRYSSWYAIIVGILIFAQWTVSFATGGVVEVQTEPIRIAFHLIGEFLTAIVLVSGGIATLTRQRHGRSVLLLGLGMLSYTLIVSPGYFAQLNRWLMVALFEVLMLGDAAAIAMILRKGQTSPA